MLRLILNKSICGKFNGHLGVRTFSTSTTSTSNPNSIQKIRSNLNVFENNLNSNESTQHYLSRQLERIIFQLYPNIHENSKSLSYLVSRNESKNNSNTNINVSKTNMSKKETETKKEITADYFTPLPLALAPLFNKQNQQSNNKNQIALEMIEKYPKDDVVDSLFTMPNGFLGIKLKDNFIQQSIQQFSTSTNKRKNLTPPTIHTKMSVLIDYSSPNMCKELHVGHLRSTILGDSLARFLEFLGHSVERVSHVGDFGTPISMVIVQALDKNFKFTNDLRNWLQKPEQKQISFILQNNSNDNEATIAEISTTNDLTVSSLSELYVSAKQRSKQDSDFTHRVAKLLQLMQQSIIDEDQKSPVFLVWKVLCETSRQGFSELYSSLEIKHLVERGESFYGPFLTSVVQELIQKKFVRQSEGALCIFLDELMERQNNKSGKSKQQKTENETTTTTPMEMKTPTTPPPFMIQKSDGTYLYGTTDLTAIKFRTRIQMKEWLLYVVDQSQEDHFSDIFSIGELAGWFSRSNSSSKFQPKIKIPNEGKPSVRIDHIKFGVMKGEDSKKLSSRKGQAPTLSGFLEDAVKHTENVLKQNFPDLASKSDFKERLNRIAYGAIKYYDLMHSKDYIFSFERMVSLKGNSAIYLMYANARIEAIKRKALNSISNNNNSIAQVLEPEERALMLQLIRFPEYMEQIQQTLALHTLCEYLYELASKFHSFYDQCRVIGSERQTQRLSLCISTQKILQFGSEILGFTLIDEM